MPTFSVIIPAFNAQATLDATIASLRAQTFDDWEAIVLDDQSTDDTASIAERHAAADPRIRVVSLPNGGPSKARNRGAAAAKGTWLAFLDADDLWSPQKLQRSAEIVRRDDAPDALYAKIAFFRDDPRTATTTSTVRPHPLTVFDLLCENAVCTSSNLLVRRSAFDAAGGFDPSLKHSEDVEFLVRLVATGARIEGIDEALVYYRASDGGLSADLLAMHEGWRRVVETAAAHGVAPSGPRLRAAEAVHLRYLARRALRVEAPRFTALRLAARAIALSPSGFFGDLRRGGLTLAAALAEPFLPRRLRQAAFRR